MNYGECTVLEIIQNFLDGIRFVFLFPWAPVQEILVFGFAIYPPPRPIG